MIVIRQTRIIGTDRVIFSAWEPTALMARVGAGHSTITHDGERGWLGRIGTSALPAEIDPIPVGPARSFAGRRGSNEHEHRRAYRALIGAHPELNDCRDARFDMGEIEVRAP